MKTAKVFANGRSRAVRIPSAWLKGADEVEIRKEGDTVVIAPIRPRIGALAEGFRKSPVFIERKKQSKTAPKTLSL